MQDKNLDPPAILIPIVYTQHNLSRPRSHATSNKGFDFPAEARQGRVLPLELPLMFELSCCGGIAPVFCRVKLSFTRSQVSCPFRAAGDAQTATLGTHLPGTVHVGCSWVEIGRG